MNRCFKSGDRVVICRGDFAGLTGRVKHVVVGSVPAVELDNFYVGGKRHCVYTVDIYPHLEVGDHAVITEGAYTNSCGVVATVYQHTVSVKFNGSGEVHFVRERVWPCNEPAKPAGSDAVAPEPYVLYYIPGPSRDKMFAYAVRDGDLVSIYEFYGSRRDQAFLNWAQHLQDAWIAVSKSEALSRVNKPAEVPKSVDEMVPAFEGPIVAVKRVPIDLWVTYRVDSEGGDWPVRCTRAGETLQNWKKIQMDGNGDLYIEVPYG
jgi:ribosomal protein L24